jgi:Cu-processing system ATP-binding protein
MTPTLTLQCLTKTYGAQRALSEVSLTVAPGERVALLGHNGAGKSTMMKIILGLIPYDSGELQVAGAAPGAIEARRHVAYLPENVAFHPALTGLEQIRHYLSLRGERPSRAIELLERVGLGFAATRRIGSYSKGMRQRVGLAQTLIGKPSLLVLDEPTSGLDPVSRRDFYELLDGLAAHGTSILLSSHALTEVEARTDRILILSAGSLVAEGSLNDLRRRAALPVTVQVTPSQGQMASVANALPDAIASRDTLTLTCGQDQKLRLLARVSNLGDSVADIDVQPPTLEDIYSHFSKRDGQ